MPQTFHKKQLVAGVSAVAYDVELHTHGHPRIFAHIHISSFVFFFSLSLSSPRFVSIHIYGRPLYIFDMIIEGVPTRPEPVDSEAGSGWKEKEFEKDMPQYQDAFGDETNAEVKYKTMEWW